MPTSVGLPRSTNSFYNCQISVNHTGSGFKLSYRKEITIELAAVVLVPIRSVGTPSGAYSRISMTPITSAWWLKVSYTLSREYRVVRNRYSRLLFTGEDRLCVNLQVQEQSTIIIRTLHDCPSQMNENLLISNSKLTSDSELIWWR